MRPENFGRGARGAAMVLSLIALTGCSDLLEVELPAELTDEVLTDPAGASMQIATVVGTFENAFNNAVWEWHGREDGAEIFARSPGTFRGSTAYASPADANAVWFAGFMTSRRFANGLHVKLEKDWSTLPQRNQFMAITSMYEGAVLGLMGSALCELSVNDGPMLKPAEVLTQAEAALTKALSEIDQAGADFAVPYGVSTSARNMAYGIRAQIRWMKGDLAGARADAERVPRGFVAYVTRDDTPSRRNFAFEAGGGGGGAFAEVNGVNDWWKGQPNPATGQPWPAVIPFTGYIDLGILPNGRAVWDDTGLPVRLTGPYRKAEEGTAVADTRVKTALQIIQGKGGVRRPTNTRYSGYGADIPLVNWKEMWLIRAEAEGGARAITLVNELRTADNLPLVTYASAGNTQQIRYMIIEERRRALYLEGRFFFTKLKNTDILWFPRAEGQTVEGSLNMGGGVRFHMPDNEFILNPNLELTHRATGCTKADAPVLDR
jgi:hypothetical protein